MSTRVKTVLWLAWVAMATWLTFGIVRWHVGYFRSPGPQFYRGVFRDPNYAIYRLTAGQ